VFDDDDDDDDDDESADLASSFCPSSCFRRSSTIALSLGRDLFHEVGRVWGLSNICERSFEATRDDEDEDEEWEGEPFPPSEGGSRGEKRETWVCRRGPQIDGESFFSAR